MARGPVARTCRASDPSGYAAGHRLRSHRRHREQGNASTVTRDSARPPVRHALFVVDFIHTNMLPVVSALRGGGVVVTVVCRTPGIAGPHLEVAPIVLDPDRVTADDVAGLLDDLRPDVIVQRARCGRFPLFARLGARRGILTVFYNQAPALRRRGARHAADDAARFIGRIVHRLPMRRVTPVLGPKDGHSTIRSRHLPFPMAVADAAHHRDYFRGGHVTIACVGKLDHPRKRHDWLLDALEQIDVPFRLLIVGTGPRPLTNDRPTAEYPQGKATGYREYYERLIERCRTPRRSGVVEVLQDVPFDQMAEIYRQCDVFALPAADEPFAISPLEAMAHGVAVLVADTNGATTYVEDDVNGRTFDASSLEDLTARLASLVTSPVDVARLGQAAAASVRRDHDPAGYPDVFRATVADGW